MEHSITFQSGADAWVWLSDADFLVKWKQLYDDCPWATPFQSPGYVRTWYENYQNQYSPVILFLEEGQRLSGLLLLALSTDRQRLRVAGAPQAEYQVWLAKLERQDEFVRQIPHVLDAALPGYSLIFKYLPKETPVQSLLEAGIFNRRAQLRRFQRPLLIIDKEDLEASFRKKSNKSRFNRLARLGELEFKRVTNEQDFAEILDEIIPFCDLRQGAVNDRYPFSQDAAKRPFHLDLLKKCPELLHVTVTTLDGKALAAHIGVIGKNQLQLGLLAYSPFYASHSPGKLHIMLLSRQLLEEGINCLDLTPGGDPWKDRFANTQDEVYALTLHTSVPARTISHLQTQGKDWIKKRFQNAYQQPDRIGLFAKSIRQFHPRKVFPTLRHFMWKKEVFRLYRHTLDRSKPLAFQRQANRDRLEDLLLYEPVEDGPSKQAFMAEALVRLERSEHAYTIASDRLLHHCAWLAEQAHEIHSTEAGQSFQLPETSAVLDHFYTHPAITGKDIFQDILGQMLSDTRESGSIKQVYILVPAGNRPSRQVLEKLGFEYQSSMYHLRILGYKKRWRSRESGEDLLTLT